MKLEREREGASRRPTTGGRLGATRASRHRGRGQALPTSRRTTRCAARTARRTSAPTAPCSPCRRSGDDALRQLPLDGCANCPIASTPAPEEAARRERKRRDRSRPRRPRRPRTSASCATAARGVRAAAAARAVAAGRDPRARRRCARTVVTLSPQIASNGAYVSTSAARIPQKYGGGSPPPDVAPQSYDGSRRAERQVVVFEPSEHPSTRTHQLSAAPVVCSGRPAALAAQVRLRWLPNGNHGTQNHQIAGRGRTHDPCPARRQRWHGWWWWEPAF